MKEFELEPGEHVVLQVRKHWFFFLMELLPYAILAAIPFAFLDLLFRLAPYPDWQSITATLPDPSDKLVIIVPLLCVWLLIVWTGAWGTFTRYFLNVWVLTNQRIVDIKQRGFFRREVSSLLLSRVQDVTTDVTGVLSSFLDIGDIMVQSAGTDIEFVMSNIWRPERMRDIVLKYVSEGPKNTGI